MAKEGDHALLKLPSGELRKVRLACRATIGQVGNLEHENISYGKAGRIRWLGRRPHVRGIAMNPVDHPHGGGEGRSKGNHPQSPWGQPAKGYKTRTTSARTSGSCSVGRSREAAVARSLKKGPFVDEHLAKKVRVMVETR